MLGLIAVRRDLSDKTQRHLSQLVFIRLYSSSLIGIDRDSRTRHRPAEGPNFMKMFVTHCMTKKLAPRGGFEPPTFRLTALCLI